MSFLALDAVLGWKVKMYDSSWKEWGNLTDEEGTLAQDSPWRTDCGIPGATACTAFPTPATITEVGDRTISTNSSPPAGCSYAPSASATNDNDKQICATGIQTLDCNSNIN